MAGDEVAGDAVAVAVAGDRVSELLALVHDIVAMCAAGAGGSSSGAAIDAADAVVFRKDCTDLVRRISLLAHLFEEIRDSSNDTDAADAVVVDSENLDDAWSSDLVLALNSSKRLLYVARNFRSNCVSVSCLLDLLSFSSSAFFCLCLFGCYSCCKDKFAADIVDRYCLLCFLRENAPIRWRNNILIWFCWVLEW